VRRLALGLIVAGLFLVGVSAYQLETTQRHQALEQQQLEAALRARDRAGRAGAPPRTAIAAASRARAARQVAWGRLEINRVGLSVALEEGIDGRTLRRAVGHVPDTPFPGEPGNVALAGHRDSLFRPLRLVREGDLVRITTLDGVFDYEVSSLHVVPPERTDLLDPGPGPELTLVTCYPFSYVGPAPLRYVVKARSAGSAAAPGHAQSVSTAAEKERGR
jgi:sortase A